MGACLSLFASSTADDCAIQICDKSDSGSDKELKAAGRSDKRDSTPLLEGSTLLAFKNLDLSSNSSCVDAEISHIGRLLEAAEQEKEDDEDGDEDGDGTTFKDANPDVHLHSSDAEIE